MSWTQDDINALKRAIAKGATTVKVGDEQITFDSLSALQRRLAMMEAEVNAAGAASRQTYPAFAPRPL
jgi:hypothetical protein